jgi:hypothetical protein
VPSAGTGAAGHLVPLPAGEFAVWKWASLRSAGFAAALADDLAAPTTAAAADELLDAQPAATAALRDAFELAASSEGRDVRRRLQRRFAEPNLELALRWQSPGALDGTIARLLRQPADLSNRRTRESERLAGRFLQRFALKNDSIGFFGPIGWAELDPRAVTSSLHVGPALTSRRFVRLEAWAVDAVLQAVELGAAAEADLTPWRLPAYFLDGARAVFPARADWARRTNLDPELGAVALAPERLRILELCDGRRTAREISDAIAWSPATASEVAATVRELHWLRTRGLIGFGLQVPQTLRADQALRRVVEVIQDPAERRRLREHVDPVLDAFAGVASAETAVELAAALEHLESTFTALTGRPARRAAGRAYAARTLVHLDTVRDARLRVGPEVISAVGPPLSLLLASARWFTHSLAIGIRAALSEIHAAIAERSGTPAPALLAFAREAMPLLTEDTAGIRAATVTEFQRRWAEILRAEETEPVIRRRVPELAPAVHESFAAAHPGWQLARYVSPDVLIAAKDLDHITDGDFELVLGEVHLDNTLSRRLFLEAHPDPGALLRARDRDILGTCVLPAPSPRFNVPRTAVGLSSPRDRWFVYENTPTGITPERMLAAGELVVERDGELVVRTRDRRFACPVIEFFGHTIANANMSLPPLLTDAPHQPRVVIDRLVVQREAWCVSASELVPGRRAGRPGPDRNAHFLAARRLRRAHGMPRRVFVRVGQDKPVCVDFDSPIMTDVLAHLASQAGPEAAIRVSEFLPDCGGLWLTDAAGARYTSELRIVALDLRSPEPVSLS